MKPRQDDEIDESGDDDHDEPAPAAGLRIAGTEVLPHDAILKAGGPSGLHVVADSRDRPSIVSGTVKGISTNCRRHLRVAAQQPPVSRE